MGIQMKRIIANYDIDDDLKLEKNTLVPVVYIKIIQHCKG